MISEKVKNQIQVVQGDITKLDCDCIVKAANRSLLGGGHARNKSFPLQSRLLWAYGTCRSIKARPRLCSPPLRR